MRYIIATQEAVIPLGRQGENNVETVQFDVSGWAEEYGEGAFELLHERCMDTAPYECPITVEENVVSWVVRSADTAYVGRGEAQLMYVVDDGVAKSVIFKTSTLKSIDGNPDFPDPYDDWLRQMHEDAEYVRENIEDALEAQEVSEAWAVGKRSGVDVGEDDPTYHNNSKYYAQQSEASATASAGSAAAAAQSAQEAAAYVGSPLVATLKSGMTDHSKVYVYVGTESGMTSGHWYYYNGSAWADGGVYNSIADDVATNADIDALIFSYRRGQIMAFKPLNEKMADIDAEGTPIMYVEATYDTGDELPTQNIYQGSWALNLSDKSVVFFNGESWG